MRGTQKVFNTRNHLTSPDVSMDVEAFDNWGFKLGIQTMKLVQLPSVAEPANGRREFLRGTAAAAAGIGTLMALTDGEAQADGRPSCYARRLPRSE
jgi:hypothetical protein